MGHPAAIARQNLLAIIGQVAEYLDTRGGGPGRPPAEIAAVNRYHNTLDYIGAHPAVAFWSGVGLVASMPFVRWM